MKTISPMIASDMDASHMANLAKVLSELKSLWSDFRTKLDNIDTRLTGMANYMESKMTQMQRDVAPNPHLRRHLVDRQRWTLHRGGWGITRKSVSCTWHDHHTCYFPWILIRGSGKPTEKLPAAWCTGRSWGPTVIFRFHQWQATEIMSFFLEKVHRTLVTGNPNWGRTILIRFLEFQEKSRRQEITYDGPR